MKYTPELIKILDNKDFKSFFECLDFLLIAGYGIIDSFGICLERFGESKIWDKVAFIRFKKTTRINIIIIDVLTGRPIQEETMKEIIFIGIMDETTIHLQGLYDVYRKALLNNGSLISSVYSDIEATCKVLSFKNLPEIINDYLNVTFEKHFGYSFKSNWEEPNTVDDSEQTRMDRLRRELEQ